MQACDKTTFSALLIAVGDLYGKSIAPAVVGMYWEALARFDLPEVRQALNAHVQHPDQGRFFPKPADLLRCLVGNGEALALVAWTEVERAIRCVGANRSVAFADPITHAVLEDMGGWIALCAVAADKLCFRATEFSKRYQGYLGRPLLRYPAYFVGAFARDNAASGFAVDDQVVLVGDPVQVREVMQGGTARAVLTREALSVLSAGVKSLPGPKKVLAANESVPQIENEAVLAKKTGNEYLGGGKSFLEPESDNSSPDKDCPF